MRINEILLIRIIFTMNELWLLRGYLVEKNGEREYSSATWGLCISPTGLNGELDEWYAQYR